jgi:hypothetical protein
VDTFEEQPSEDALRDLRTVSPYPGDDGELVGIDIPARSILQRYHRPLPPLKAIRARCLDCCCQVPSEVLKCTAVMCPSWPYRMGTNPFREKKVTSPEQIRAMVEARRAKSRAA